MDLTIFEQNKKMHKHIRLLMLYSIYGINKKISLPTYISLQIYDKNAINWYNIETHSINEHILDVNFSKKIINEYKITTFLFSNKNNSGHITLSNLSKLLVKSTGYNYTDLGIIYDCINNKKTGFISKDWITCRLPSWKEGTYTIYINVMKKLSIYLEYSDDFYYQDMLVLPENSDKLITIIANNSLSPATNELYLKTILVYLEHFSVNVPMNIFAQYAKEKNRYAEIERKLIEVPCYTIIYDKLVAIIDDKLILPIIKKIALIYKDIGILRYSDLRYTQLKEKYDENCPYSQLCPDKYYIKKEYTKNGKDRSFAIPADIYDKLMMLQPEGCNWLLEEEPDVINMQYYIKLIQNSIPYNLNILRGSAETYSIKNYSKEKSEELSYIMGHTFKTVIKYYYRE